MCLSAESFRPSYLFWLLCCSLKLGVGDAHSDNHVPVALLVTPDMTISDLKEKVKQMIDATLFSPTAIKQYHIYFLNMSYIFSLFIQCL